MTILIPNQNIGLLSTNFYDGDIIRSGGHKFTTHSFLCYCERCTFVVTRKTPAWRHEITTLVLFA